MTDSVTGRLFGRGNEQRYLHRAMDALQDGTGQIVWITGEPGSGKTALVDYLRTNARARGIDVLSGGVGSTPVDAPFAAWVPAVRVLRDDDDNRREPAVEAVMSGTPPDSEPLTDMAPAARLQYAVSRFAECVRLRRARNPHMMIVLDDCDRMDSASWRLIRRVAEDQPRLLIVLTSRRRPSEAPDRWPEVRRLQALPQFLEWQLRAIGADETTKLVRQLLGKQASDTTIQQIVTEAEGVPARARQLSLLSRSGLPLGHGHDTSLDGIIRKRLEVLMEEEEKTSVLRAASVLGDTDGFDAGIVSVVCSQLDETTVAGHLKYLFDQEFLGGDNARGPFCFAHREVSARVYGMIPPAEAKALNSRAARALDERGPQDVTHLPRLTRLWERGEQANKALGAAKRAAHHAFEWGAFREAVPLLRKCREISMAHATRGENRRLHLVRWCRRLADAHNGLAEVESRRIFAWEALRWGHAPRPTTGASLAWAVIRRCWRLAMRCWRLAMTRHRSTNGDRGERERRRRAADMAGAYRRSMEGCYFSNQRLGLLHDILGAIEMGWEAKTDVHGDLAALGGAVAVAGGRYWGLRPLGERILDAACEGDGFPESLAYAHLIRGLYYVARGGEESWSKATKSLDYCTSRCDGPGLRRFGDPVMRTYAQTQLFWLHYYKGENECAQKVGNRLEASARDHDNPHQLAVALECQTVCDLRLAEDPTEKESRATHLSRAVVRINEAVENLSAMSADNVWMPVLAVCALAHYEDGRVDQGSARARVAHKFLGSSQMTLTHGLLEGYSALFRVALHQWRADPPAARRSDVKRCLGMLERYKEHFPVGTPRYWLHLGNYWAAAPLATTRTTKNAAQCYINGAREAERLGMEWDAQRCRVALETN